MPGVSTAYDPIAAIFPAASRAGSALGAALTNRTMPGSTPASFA
jgi:hypothetical protein